MSKFAQQPPPREEPSVRQVALALAQLVGKLRRFGDLGFGGHALGTLTVEILGDLLNVCGQRAQPGYFLSKPLPLGALALKRGKNVIGVLCLLSPFCPPWA